jgi:hypothetical protein
MIAGPAMAGFRISARKGKFYIAGAEVIAALIGKYWQMIPVLQRNNTRIRSWNVRQCIKVQLFAFRKSFANDLPIETGKRPKNGKKRLFSRYAEAAESALLFHCKPLVYSVF